MPSWEALRLVARAQRVAAPPAAIVDAATWLLKLGPERQPALHVPAQLLLLEAVRAPPRRPSPRAHLRLIRRADRATARVALLRVVVAARLAAVWVAQRASRLSTRGLKRRSRQSSGQARRRAEQARSSGRREQAAAGSKEQRRRRQGARGGLSAGLSLCVVTSTRQNFSSSRAVERLSSLSTPPRLQ